VVIARGAPIASSPLQAELAQKGVTAKAVDLDVQSADSVAAALEAPARSTSSSTTPASRS